MTRLIGTLIVAGSVVFIAFRCVAAAKAALQLAGL